MPSPPQVRGKDFGGALKVVVGHLYPDYLNIYADRGNMAVLERRAAWRGIGFDYREIGLGEKLKAEQHDLLYLGGGQDREQELIASDLSGRGAELGEAVAGGVAVLAVCGGYQLLGRFYRDRSGVELPGAAVLPLHTVAGEQRMIGDVLIACELDQGRRRTVAGFENHGGCTILDENAEPLGRVISGFGNDGKSGLEGCRRNRAIGTYLHGPLLPRNPWLADWILGQALAHHHGGEPPELEPLTDELEAQAHKVSARRARSRGGGRPGGRRLVRRLRDSVPSARRVTRFSSQPGT